ncbi:MAG TPA: ABC transporter permease [Microthrixaceae bacterium]|nr:ABC transporter permease [Microthrixaceae bacterium]
MLAPPPGVGAVGWWPFTEDWENQSGMNDGGKLLARTLRRRHRRATILLGLGVGLAAGIVMLGAVSARRSSDAIDRFVEEASRGVDALVWVCPPLTGPEGEPLDRDTQLFECFTYTPDAELDLVESIPGVDVLGRLTAPVVEIEADGLSTFGAPYIYLPTPGRGDPASLLPPLASGRFPSGPDEAVVDEATLAETGLELGDELTLTPFTAEQQFLLGDPSVEPGATPSTARLVGTIREPATLIAGDGDPTGGDHDRLYLTSEWFDQYDGTELARWGTQFMVSTDMSIEELDAAVRASLREEYFAEISPNDLRDPLVVRPSRRAIELETIATWVAVVVLAAAACVFVGQSLARQTRREWDDGPTLRALSLTRTDAAIVAALRASTIAAVSVFVAVGVTVAASTLTPVGIARRADPDLGLVVDLPVLLVGIGVVVGGVIAISALSASRALAPRRVRRLQRSSLLARLSRRVAERPAAWAGVTFAGDGRPAGRTARRAAVTTVGAAAVVAMLAVILPASLTELVDDAEEYGAVHDAYVGGTGAEDAYDDNVERVGDLPHVEAAGGVMQSTAYAQGESMELLTFVPIEGQQPIRPKILDGREPIREDEVVLGRATMRDLGLDVGDRVELKVRTEEIEEDVPATIVGTAVVHGETDTEPGRGGFVSYDAIRAVADDPDDVAPPSSVIVKFEPGHREEGLREMRATMLDVKEPHPQSDLRNLARVSFVPGLLTILVVVLAIAALAHALVLATRRHRVELGALRAIGFTRRQAEASMLWMATALVGAALLVGLPLGFLVGRMLWRALMANLGLEPAAVTHWGVWIVVPVVALVVANLAALIPAHRAASMSPAEALRAD